MSQLPFPEEFVSEPLVDGVFEATLIPSIGYSIESVAPANVDAFWLQQVDYPDGTSVEYGESEVPAWLQSVELVAVADGPGGEKRYNPKVTINEGAWGLVSPEAVWVGARVKNPSATEWTFPYLPSGVLWEEAQSVIVGAAALEEVLSSPPPQYLITHHSNSQFVRINLVTNEVTTFLAPLAPQTFVFSDDKTKIYYLDSDGVVKMSNIDGSNVQVIDNTGVGYGSPKNGYFAIDVDNVNGFLFVSNGYDVVTYKYNLNDFSKSTYSGIGSFANTKILCDPVTQTIYLSGQNGQVDRYDYSGVAQTMPFYVGTFGGSPVIEIDNENGFYFARGYSQVVRIPFGSTTPVEVAGGLSAADYPGCRQLSCDPPRQKIYYRKNSSVFMANYDGTDSVEIAGSSGFVGSERSVFHLL